MNKQFSNVNAEPDFCVDFGNLSNCFLSLKNHVSESCPSTASKNRLKIKSAQYFCIFEFQNLSLEGEKICLKEAVKVRWHHCHRFLDWLNYKECLRGCFILPLFTSEWDLQKRRWFLVCRKGASVRAAGCFHLYLQQSDILQLPDTALKLHGCLVLFKLFSKIWSNVSCMSSQNWEWNRYLNALRS